MRGCHALQGLAPHAGVRDGGEEGDGQYDAPKGPGGGPGLGDTGGGRGKGGGVKIAKNREELDKVVSEIFEEASDYLSCDLWKITKNGPESKINDTEFTQPIMLCSAFSVWKIWNDEGGEKPIFMAGHSFGEYTALCASEAVKFRDAVKLVKKRAECMKAAPEGVMAAIVGIDYNDLKSVYDENKLTEVSIANINAPGQIVISGDEKSVLSVCEKLKERGAKRTILLKVDGAFHSPLMKDAKNDFELAFGEA